MSPRFIRAPQGCLTAGATSSHLTADLNFNPLPISPMECHYVHMNQQFVFGKGGGEIGRRVERVG